LPWSMWAMMQKLRVRESGMKRAGNMGVPPVAVNRSYRSRASVYFPEKRHRA
jgi:hypothetical protein